MRADASHQREAVDRYSEEIVDAGIEPSHEAGNGLENKRGTIAMARTNNPDSASAQWFINLKDNDFLDRAKARDKVGYAVFGKVISGMDVVDKIAGSRTAVRNGMRDVPVDPPVITSARRKAKKREQGRS